MASHLFSSTHSSLVLLVGCSVMVAQLPSSISSWATALKKNEDFKGTRNEIKPQTQKYCTVHTYYLLRMLQNQPEVTAIYLYRSVYRTADHCRKGYSIVVCTAQGLPIIYTYFIVSRYLPLLTTSTSQIKQIRAFLRLSHHITSYRPQTCIDSL